MDKSFDDSVAKQWLLLFWQSLADLHVWPIDLLPEHPLQLSTDADNQYQSGAPGLHLN